MYPMSPEVYYREYDKQVAAALLRQAGKTEAQPVGRSHVPWPKVRTWLSALRGRVELRNHPVA